jgi:hypothetical protein
MRTFLSTLVAVFLTAIPAAVFADYAYTFQVPVTASNLPANTGLQATCILFSGALGGGSTLSFGTSPNAKLTNGGYSGSLTVTASSATKPGSYQCIVLVKSGANNLNLVGTDPKAPASGWSGTMQTTANIP